MMPIILGQHMLLCHGSAFDLRIWDPDPVPSAAEVLASRLMVNVVPSVLRVFTPVDAECGQCF